MSNLVPDIACPGLYLRDGRFWYVQKRIGAKLHRYKIGVVTIMSPLEARIEAVSVLRDLAAGIDPVEQRRQAKRKDLTVSELFERYYTEHVVSHTARPKEVRQAFDRLWIKLACLHVSRLSQDNIQTWMNDLAQHQGKSVANRQFSNLRAAIRWGIRMQAIDIVRDPSIGVEIFKLNPRENFLKAGDEYQALAASLEKHAGDVADAVWMLLLTGARKSTLLAMRWQDLDLKHGVWTTPSKGKRICNIPLTSRALAILLKRHELSNFSQWVFPSQESTTGHLVAVDRTWHLIRKDAGLPELRLHDLRHTAASWLGLNGANAFVIKDAMGHSSVKMTERYTHLGNAMTARDELEKAQGKAIVG